MQLRWSNSGMQLRGKRKIAAKCSFVVMITLMLYMWDWENSCFYYILYFARGSTKCIPEYPEEVYAGVWWLYCQSDARWGLRCSPGRGGTERKKCASMLDRLLRHAPDPCGQDTCFTWLPMSFISKNWKWTEVSVWALKFDRLMITY